MKPINLLYDIAGKDIISARFTTKKVEFHLHRLYEEKIELSEDIATEMLLNDQMIKRLNGQLLVISWAMN